MLDYIRPYYIDYIRPDYIDYIRPDYIRPDLLVVSKMHRKYHILDFAYSFVRQIFKAEGEKREHGILVFPTSIAHDGYLLILCCVVRCNFNFRERTKDTMQIFIQTNKDLVT